MLYYEDQNNPIPRMNLNLKEKKEGEIGFVVLDSPTFT